MIEVKLGILRGQEFGKVLSKIYTHDFASVKNSFSCLSKIKKIREEVKKANETHQEIFMKYVRHDENDKPIVENNHYVLIEDKNENFNKDMLELDNQDLTFEVEKFTFDELESIKLSPFELEIFESCIDV